MFGTEAREQRQIRRATELFEYLRGRLNTRVSIRLWDGSVIPLGDDPEPGLEVSIKSAGVISTLLRRPKPDTLLRLYARGAIDYHGTDLVSLIETARVKNSRKKTRGLPLGLMAKFASSFLMGKGESLEVDHHYDGDETGLKRDQADNKDCLLYTSPSPRDS